MVLKESEHGRQNRTHLIATKVAVQQIEVLHYKHFGVPINAAANIFSDYHAVVLNLRSPT